MLRRDGLLYTLIQRNDFVALYSVGGTNSDKTTHYEVIKIYLRKPNRYEKYEDKDTLIECLPSNENFGKDLSRPFNDLESAKQYYEDLSLKYNKLHGTHRLVTGVKKNVKVIQEYQLEAA